MLPTSTRPSDSSTGPPPPQGAPQQVRRPPVPLAKGPALTLVTVAAVMANFAVQGRVASAAGWCAVATTAAAILAAPARRSRTALFAAGTAAVLGSNLILRASDWVTGPTVIACIGLLTLAALDRLTTIRLRGVLDDVLRLTLGLIDSPTHLSGPIRAWLGRGSSERVVLLRGVAVAGGVVALLTFLLANADAVVGELIGQSFDSSFWAHGALSLVFALPIGAVAAVSQRAATPPAAPWISTSRPIEALMGLGATALVLASWVGVQVTIALGGADHILASASMTRAEYARDGFFELVLVVVVVLSLTATLGALLDRHRSAMATGLVALVGALTVVLVGVAFSRMSLYIEAFGLTMLRLAVAWFLGWLAVVVIAVTARIAGVGGGRAWLVPFVIITAALVVGAYGWSNPEARVAATNLGRGNATVQLDERYLEGLGPDAGSTLRVAGLADPNLCPESVHPYGLLGWNRSWALAC